MDGLNKRKQKLTRTRKNEPIYNINRTNLPAAQFEQLDRMDIPFVFYMVLHPYRRRYAR